MPSIDALPLGSIFEKPLDRAIDTVIKADGDRELALELDEFVITTGQNGMANGLINMLEAYIDPDSPANGVWISGYYGSGKSHLLKVLSLALENKTIDGVAALEHLQESLKETPELEGLFEQATALHPSESVLFNINTLASGGNRTEATLSAFIAAFNRHRGYYVGNQDFVAAMEADLDAMGLLDQFKARVEELAGRPWSAVSQRILAQKRHVNQAWAEVTHDAQTDVVSNYSRSYRPSVESFVNDVAAYIKQKQAATPGFRLNFFVDEVGQFIAKNDEAMIALQTIAEGLNTACGGSSWIMVTSQEDFTAAVGKLEGAAAYDFSKIQARFSIKIALAAEASRDIIEHRLLKKAPDAEPDLELIYQEHSQDFGMLFRFDAKTSHGWAPPATFEEFNGAYPFVPYQFSLFIDALSALTNHDIFTGKSHSNAARNMLGTFQDMGKRMLDQNLTLKDQPLATFDAAFDSLRSSMRQEELRLINDASDIVDELSQRVLKALFLVKHVGDFSATPSNLRVLLYGTFLENTQELEENIKIALENLMARRFVRYNPEHGAYEYLTNEEKAVEQEISNVTFSTQELDDALLDLLAEVAGTNRVTYTAQNGTWSRPFSYNVKANQTQKRGTHYDLTVQLMTDEASVYDVPALKTLQIRLSHHGAFMGRLQDYLKTRIYLGLHGTEEGMRRAIIESKRAANTQLWTQLIDELKPLLGKATYLLPGTDVTPRISGDGKAAVQAGALELVRHSYPNLALVTSKIDEATVTNHATKPLPPALIDALPTHAATVLRQLELFEHAVPLAGEAANNLMDIYTKKDYGWDRLWLLDAVAILSTSGNAEVRSAMGVLQKQALADALKQQKKLPTLKVKRLVRLDQQQLDELRRAFAKALSRDPLATNQAGLMDEFASELASTIQEFNAQKSYANNYPFKAVFADKLQQLKMVEMAMREDKNEWIINNLRSQADAICHAREELRTMIEFMRPIGLGTTYNLVRAYYNQGLTEATALGVEEGTTDELKKNLEILMHDPHCYTSGLLQTTAPLVKKANAKIKAAKQKLRQSSEAELEAYRALVMADSDWQETTDESRERVTALFDQAVAELKDQENVYAIRTATERFKDAYSGAIVALLAARHEPEPGPVPEPEPVPSDDNDTDTTSGGGDTTTGPGPVNPPEPPTTIPVTMLSKGVEPAFIKTEADVDAYLTNLRSMMLEQIHAHAIITN